MTFFYNGKASSKDSPLTVRSQISPALKALSRRHYLQTLIIILCGVPSATSSAGFVPTAGDVGAAAARIRSLIHHTPLIRNRSTEDRAGHALYLKCENLQRTGSFKIRGALNALLQLDAATRECGVVAFSSGNHAQAVARAAAVTGIRATIVMPEDSVETKASATRGYGAEVIQSGVTISNRAEIAGEIARNTNAAIIPPFDHPHIIAGAGTAALEILGDLPEASSIVVPLGGGGLLAGTVLAATGSNPSIRVYGVEPAAGDDGRRSFLEGKIVTIPPPRTIADGARTTALGELNFAIIRSRVEDVVTVTDDELLDTLGFVITRTRLLVEPTGALALAAILHHKIPSLPPPVVAILSGGNVELSLLARLA
jgi:threo-3-hydroxy-L-aspartate ammonia-lyase